MHAADVNHWRVRYINQRFRGHKRKYQRAPRRTDEWQGRKEDY